MTNYNKPPDLQQDEAVDTHYNVADDVNGSDHTNGLGIYLHNANDRHIDLNIDGYDVKYLLRPGASTNAIATGAAIVAVFLVALVTVTAAIAVAIIAVALLSCLRICRERERARVNAPCNKELETSHSMEEVDQKGYEADLDS
jgi:hypothetical protein